MLNDGDNSNYNNYYQRIYGQPFKTETIKALNFV